MRRNTAHPSPGRALLSAAAFLVLLFAGAGIAQADEGHRGRGGEHRYDRHDRDHDRRRHRGDYRHDRRHDRRGDYRHDRRHDRHHRYDRHRGRHDRYEHYRYDRRYRPPYGYGHRSYGHRPYRPHFEIPWAIDHRHRGDYRHYRHGRVYHEPHRHYHEVYRFPVYGPYGVGYYPYAYCEGSFFGRGIFRGGRAVFDIHINF